MPLIIESGVDYDRCWTEWNDMIRYSPAPFHRRRLILKALGRIQFSSVLDVGCGNAETLVAVASTHRQAELVGVDLSALVIADNCRRLPQFRFFPLDIEQVALDRIFDAVICSEVIEHCRDYQRALRNLRRMTGGHLILTVPAGPRLPIDCAMGHHRHFTPALLREALQGSGFEIDRIFRWGFPFHTLYKLIINRRPDQMMHAFASGSYGVTQKAVGQLVRQLFYLNLPNMGWQLVAVARAV